MSDNPTKPKALDLFCKAGGASMGLHQSGFDVTGVDIEPQPRYPFRFVQADALTFPLEGYDFIWASPPCQAYSALRHLHSTVHPELIDSIRERLKMWGGPFVIENVPGAPLRSPAILCGSSFGLKVRRHRLFETNWHYLPGKMCRHSSQGRPIDVSGTGGRRINRRAGDHGGNINKPRNIQEARDAIGIDWMTRKELSQAIPPAYSKYIGEFAMQHIREQQGKAVVEAG